MNQREGDLERWSGGDLLMSESRHAVAWSTHSSALVLAGVLAAAACGLATCGPESLAAARSAGGHEERPGVAWGSTGSMVTSHAVV